MTDILEGQRSAQRKSFTREVKKASRSLAGLPSRESACNRRRRVYWYRLCRGAGKCEMQDLRRPRISHLVHPLDIPTLGEREGSSDRSGSKR